MPSTPAAFALLFPLPPPVPRPPSPIHPERRHIAKLAVFRGHRVHQDAPILCPRPCPSNYPAAPSSTRSRPALPPSACVRLCSPFPDPAFQVSLTAMTACSIPSSGSFHLVLYTLSSASTRPWLPPSPVASTPSRHEKPLRHPTNTNANHAFLSSSLVQSPPHRRHHRRVQRAFVARASGSLEKSSTPKRSTPHHHQTASPRRQPRHHGRTRSTGGV